MCYLCDKKEIFKDGMCKQCYQESEMDQAEITRLKREDDHTDHCARRIVYGDGECECKTQTKEV